MKKIIYLGTAIILMSFAFGLQYGDIISQTQYNNINFTTINLNFDVGNYYLKGDKIVLQFNIDTLQKVNYSHYKYTFLTQQGGGISYNMYRDCLSLYTVADCNQFARTYIGLNTYYWIQIHRTRLSSYQTTISTDFILS